MKKLINYLLYLIFALSAVFITNNIINFSKKVVILNEVQQKAFFRSEMMLEPVVRLTQLSYSSKNIEGNPQSIESVIFATGFSIKYNSDKNKTTILTNDHFCENLNENTLFIVENYLGETVFRISDDVNNIILLTKKDMDLCAVEITGYVKPAIIKPVSYDPLLFEEVFIIGGPAGDFPIIIDTYLSSRIAREKISFGNMSSLGNSGDNFLMISEQVFPGHSGSPIYAKDGEVIGILFGALRSYGGLGASQRDIHSFLDFL